MTKDTSKEPGPPKARQVTIPRKTLQMFEAAPDGASWGVYLSKAMADSQAKTNRTDNVGMVQHPFDWASAKRFKHADPHHSSCLEAKVAATVGLGFVNEEVAKLLDPLCLVTIQDVITAVNEDFWTVGNGFLEVVREGEEIVGLFHIAAEDVHVEIEDGEKLSFHYRVRQATGMDSIAAAYGFKDELVERAPSNAAVTQPDFADSDKISEIIHIRRPSAMHRWYGMPDWLAAVAQIELAQCITQYNYDFFLNNGVPEFIFMIAGADLGDTWEKEIVPALKGATGMGNGHSTVAVNIPETNVTMMVEKLGVEMADGWFQNMLDTVAVRIVTAHRVPPIIAGIQTPGKLGANNEQVNAMWMFQGLVVGPAQKVTSSCLAVTLGSEDGIDGLDSEGDFEFKKLTTEIPTANLEAPSSPTEPAKELGTRKDIPGTAVLPTPQERQAASLAKYEARIAKAREDLGDEVVDAILQKTYAVIAKHVEETMSADAAVAEAEAETITVSKRLSGLSAPK